jgi:photosystem II stability/assembly factor-like uncharacterized protein
MRGFWTVAVLVAYCVCLAGADEASSWQIREVPDQHPLWQIFFVNDNIGWMLRGDGLNALLKTSDGGKAWTPLTTNLTDRRTHIANFWFADEKRGWAVGEVRQQPTIWETHDGGSSWIEKFMEARAFEGSNGAMLDIRFVDPSHGWAVGYNGLKATIKVTYDAGEHWITQYSGGEITNQFNLVRFWDSMHGWVLGFDSVMHTDDGGESWELQYFGVGSNLDDIDLVGPSEAWIAGDWGHLLHIKDRRDSSEVPLTGSIGDSFIGWVRFATKDIGWAWGGHGEIVMTRDGGKTWTREDIPLKLDPDSDFVGDGAMTGSNLLIMVSPGRLLVRPSR